MTSVNCLIYCFDAITGQVLQIERVTSKFFKICRHRYFHRNLKITKKQRQQNLFHQKIKYEEQYEMPQRACDGICPKSKNFIFGSFFKIDHVLIIQKAPLFYVRNFPIWYWKLGKCRILNISNIEKWGISNYSHVINFKTEKEPISNKSANGITW